MKIKFHETLYNLYVAPDVFSTGIRICLYKDENTYDHIIEDTASVDDIYLYEDDGETLKAIYSGYTKRIAFTIMDEFGYICVEFNNPSIEELINSLSATVNQVQETQVAQQESINHIDATKLNNSVLAGEEEHIGQPSNKSYAVGDTFTADGAYYKAVAYITMGNTLVENGNCEITTIDNELNAKKEEEE